METNNHINYDMEKSSQRMNEILDAENKNFSDSESIPQRVSLTYTNGYYVDITALFIDIVGSSDMTDEHKRPTLAKMYRCFISECTAIMNAQSTCKEISINGDCVWGVFETHYKSDIVKVFEVAAQLISMIKILNYKLRKKGYGEISVGIGIDDGRALMVKAGYSGSGLNDVIWMGDVVNSACHLANTAGRNGYKPVIVSSYIKSNLTENYQNFLDSITIDQKTCYEGNIFNISMEKWYEENCK